MQLEPKTTIEGQSLIIHYNKLGSLRGTLDDSSLLIGDLTVGTNHRGKGYGTKLVDHAIQIAKDRGLMKIYGNVCAKDLKENPFLLDWYQRKGFIITKPIEGFAEHGIEMIL